MSTAMPDFSFKHVDQADEPNFSASDFKDHLDVQAREIRDWFNATHIGTDKSHIGDNPAARVYHNAAQSIANSSYVSLSFNQERYDNDTIHDNATNNTRLTCKTPGRYIIIANVEFASSGVGLRELYLRLNNSLTIADTSVLPITGYPTNLSVSTVYEMTLNDYVEVFVYQSSGGALNVNSSTRYSPEFMMVRVG